MLRFCALLLVAVAVASAQSTEANPETSSEAVTQTEAAATPTAPPKASEETSHSEHATGPTRPPPIASSTQPGLVHETPAPTKATNETKSGNSSGGLHPGIAILLLGLLPFLCRNH